LRGFESFTRQVRFFKSEKYTRTSHGKTVKSAECHTHAYRSMVPSRGMYTAGLAECTYNSVPGGYTQVLCRVHTPPGGIPDLLPAPL